jgi:autotransporter-associated beta strand protein
LSIYGTNNTLTFQGAGTVVLYGDPSVSDANHYTGGTYVRGGTVILRAVVVSTSTAQPGGGSYAVSSIQAIDTGATVQLGTTNNGTTNFRPGGAANGDGQILRGNNHGRLNLTGGTFDNQGDNNGGQYPPPEGFGTIVNSSPYVRSVLKLAGPNTGQTFVFNGQIKDGGLNVTTSQGTAYQNGIDMNGGGPYTLQLGGSNSFTGSVRLNTSGNGNKIVMTSGGTLGYPATINIPSRHILMNAGRIDFNGTSQKMGVVWTKGDGDGCFLTNSAFGTVSTLTVAYNVTNLTAAGNSGSVGGITCSIKDDPTTGGTIAITKEGVGVQVIGGNNGVNGVLGTPVNNYHGDTVVNNGTLAISNSTAISPNSAYYLNTPGVLNLNYAGSANVRQLWVNGIQRANGTYGVVEFPGKITGTGTLTVTGSTAVAPTLGIVKRGNTLCLSWDGVYKLQSSTNNVLGTYTDYPGGGTSAVSVPINPAVAVYFRLSSN